MAWGEPSHQHPIFITTEKSVRHGWILTFNNMISEPNLPSWQGSFTSPDIVLTQGPIFPARYSFQVPLLLYQKAEQQQYHLALNKLLLTKKHPKYLTILVDSKLLQCFIEQGEPLKLIYFPLLHSSPSIILHIMLWIYLAINRGL